MNDEPKPSYCAAVVGAGRIGMLLEDDPKRLKPASHFGMWASHPRTELVALCDSDPGKFEIARSRIPNIKTFASVEEMLGTVNPDVISISTWKDSHYDMMKLALDYDVPAIVLEKPIAEKLEHAQEIVEEADRKGIHILVNHRRRFDPLLQKLRLHLADGLIGDIIQVSSYYVFGLVTTGTHLIDALRMLLTDIAGEIEWVWARQCAFSSFHPEDDPNYDAVIGFENGLKVSIQSLSMKDYDFFEVQFYGRNGKVVFKNIGRDIEIYDVVESSEHTGFTELSDSPRERLGGLPRDLFTELANNAVDCLDGKATSLSTGADSLIALSVLMAIQRSAELDGEVQTL